MSSSTNTENCLHVTGGGWLFALCKIMTGTLGLSSLFFTTTDWVEFSIVQKIPQLIIKARFIISAHFSLFPFFGELAFPTHTLLLSSGLDRFTAEIRRIYTFSSPCFLPHLRALLWPPFQQLSGPTSCPRVHHAGQSVPHRWLSHRGSGSHLRWSGRPSVFAGCRVTFMFLLRHLLNVLTGWRLCSSENGGKPNHDKMDVFVNINQKHICAVDVPHLILWWDLVPPGGCLCVLFCFLTRGAHVWASTFHWGVFIFLIAGSSDTNVSFKAPVKYSVEINMLPQSLWHM